MMKEFPWSDSILRVFRRMNTTGIVLLLRLVLALRAIKIHSNNFRKLVWLRSTSHQKYFHRIMMAMTILPLYIIIWSQKDLLPISAFSMELAGPFDSW